MSITLALSGGDAERLGDSSVSLPDLPRQAVELDEALLSVAHLLAPARVVDRQDPVEVGRCLLVQAVEGELVARRDDADGWSIGR